jgi:hypothetical protein
MLAFASVLVIQEIEMSRNTAMAEAAQMAEKDMDVFRLALQQRAAKRQAAAQATRQQANSKAEATVIKRGTKAEK